VSRLPAGLWIIPVGILGALVGSFLNVVIFRLPRGLSVCSPAWSFCPMCRRRIRPWHNVPILGWLMLRGRCHSCGTAISIAYPVVECATVLVFIAVWDAYFVGQVAAGATGMTTDLLTAAAMIVMFCGLVATAGMDIESYLVEISVPLLTTVAAVVLLGIAGAMATTPTTALGDMAASAAWRPPGPEMPPGLVIVLLAGGVGWLIGHPLLRRWSSGPVTQEPATSEMPAPDETLPNAAADAGGRASVDSPSPEPVEHGSWPIVSFALALAGLVAWMLAAPQWPGASAARLALAAGQWRGLATVGLLLLVLILSSMVRREADGHMATTIERERLTARSVAMRELLLLVPAILAGLVVLFWLRRQGYLSLDWPGLIGLLSGEERAGASHSWVWGCLIGAARCLAHALFAAAMGWAVRIGGTMAFGKEAFGTGDIYLMAAIAAAGGWWLMVIGFFASALLALVGVLATSLHKTSRAIPFGPWLGLGAFAAMFMETGLTSAFGPAGRMFWGWISGQAGAAGW
jgi:prepilin signal peptidase PulO-like enzyme (type II secretory pathway)